MGRTGTEVYNILSEKYGLEVMGIDQDMGSVQKHLSENRNVLHGDISDIEFWQRIQTSDKLQMAILATANHAIDLQVIKQLGELKTDLIAALSRYDDEMQELKKAGIQVVFNLYAEAGAGYAEHIARAMNME